MAVFVAWVVTAGFGLAADPAAPPVPVAHRGLFRHAPENTLPAFAACSHLRLGFEVDVRVTKDGHLVSVHDDTLARTGGRPAKVTELTLTELRMIEVGGWFDPAFRGELVPTLGEVLADAKRHAPGAPLIALDLKTVDPVVVSEVADLVRKYDLRNRVVCIGLAITDVDLRKRLRAADPLLPVAVLAQTAADFPAALKDPHGDWVYVRFVPTAEHIAAARAVSKRVFAAGPLFAGQETENWRASAAAGADAILTDYPLELRQAVKATP